MDTPTFIASDQENGAYGSSHGIINRAGCGTETIGVYGKGAKYVANKTFFENTPVNTSPPVLTFTDWSTDITVSDGVWGSCPSLTYTYQWQRDGVDIAGETANTYTTDVVTDVGTSITCIVTATNIEGSASATSNSFHSWAPEDITTSAWYDAADTGTITESAGSVSQWDDKSGNNNYVEQSNASLQPLTGSTLNGINALDFDATDYLKRTLATPISFSQIQIISVAQFRNNAGKVFQHIARFDNSVTSDTFMIRENGADPSLQVSANSGGATTFSNSDGTLQYNTPFLARSRYDGANTNVYLNGGTSSVGGGLTGIIDIDELFISYMFNQMDGIIGEVICIPSGDDDLGKKAEGYLAWKWGVVSNLPSNHPYKTAPPEA